MVHSTLWHRYPYNGEVAGDRGMTREAVYYKHRHTVRMASDEELNLMLMRSSRPQKVKRRGVTLKIAGQPLDYISPELRMLMGREVYLRYDPENLDTVRVYDLEDELLERRPNEIRRTGKDLILEPHGRRKTPLL